MKRTLLLFVLLLCIGAAEISAQSTPAPLQQSLTQQLKLRKSSIFRNYPLRSVGPVVMGGRITDLAVDPRDPSTFYIGYASGGVFKTTSNGQHFTPIFDKQGALGVGDLALSPSNPDILWVGTGENNSSRSSYAGNGVYKSDDGGLNWQYMGLPNSQHIGRIIIHPKDPNTVWVAVIGALYTETAERGLYKTTDGGKTWKQTLFIDEHTGLIDLTIDPQNPNRLYAAAWDRKRQAWNFRGEGQGSAIYVSTDGGDKWKKSVKGFPQSEKIGRIGLAVAPSQPQTVYAVLDNQTQDKSQVKEDTIAGLTLRDFRNYSVNQVIELRESQLDSFLRGAGFPDRYTAEQVRKDLEAKTYEPADIANYFGDANEDLFQTAIKGLEIYRSDDYGKSWKLQHEIPLTGVVYTYGYYFGQVRVSPDNPDEIYSYGVPFLHSVDGGKNWERLDSGSVHVDHHALWINPKDTDHMLLGNDGGLYQTYDRGHHWNHLNNMAVGQFYTVAVDEQEPYNIYGGLQDNGVFMGSSKGRPNDGRYWKRIWGGDGMFVALDSRDPELVYTGYQFGHYFRIDRKNGKPVYITPKHDIGAEKYRWNWRTPLRRSPHSPEILYFGSQYLFRSLDRGDNWETISPDLTTNRKDQGNVPYSTLTDFSESPLQFGMIWTGSDDGKVQLTPDGGLNWQDVSAGLPTGLWVSKILASPHEKKTAFVTLTGYRNDDFRTYVYRTDDLGKSWQDIGKGLPSEPCNVILQDPVHPELLYLGTDFNLYISVNAGQTWNPVSQLPNVAVYDLAIAEKARELVIATHGRSIFVQDLAPIYELMGETNAGLVAIGSPEITWNKEWGKKEHPWMKPELPTLRLHWYQNKEANDLRILLKDSEGKLLREWRKPGQAGFNYMDYDLRWGGFTNREQLLRPGTYTLELDAGSYKTSQEILVKEPKE